MIYERGLRFLVESQQDDGSWSTSGDRYAGKGSTGVTGLCVMAFLASGEDPNFGRYSSNVRRGVRQIMLAQDLKTGYLPGSMYHHGFAMLGLSEAYGMVDDSALWGGSEPKEHRRTIGQALDLAVRCAVTAQKNNQFGGWRYSPKDSSADTSVSGAVLVGLLAARNAGIEVPDKTVDKALAYFRSNTSKEGVVAYSGGLGGFGASMNRSAIATLVFAIGKKKDWEEYGAARDYITARLEHRERSYPQYFRYYMAQALFQGDYDAWRRWNRETIRLLKNAQLENGSFASQRGIAYGTSMSLLALALNYRFLPIYER
ncbi:MAG: squalene--hopene cyclase [Phycisphaerae bacterium]|nr:squalene--hopene cyclase [Phycisphaerae bacterium]